MSRMLVKTGVVLWFALLAVVLAGPAGAEEKAAPHEQMSLDQVSNELNNPLTSLWSINNEFDFQYYGGDAGGDELQAVWQFRPVMPVDLGNNWIYVNRPTIPVVFQQPYFNTSSFSWDEDSGLGDIQYLGLIGKSLPNGVVWAGGFTSSFPSASPSVLGSGKWSVGPAFAVATLQKKYVLGALYQQWWSVAGQEDRDNVNFSALQVFYFLNFANGWQVGGSPVLSANWMADSDNRYNVPVGLGVFKTLRLGRLPVRIGVEYDYSVVQEDTWGRDYLIKFVITPVIPSLF
ncbi:hypothetical protein [Desulfoferula mesophila]|uniref:Neuromedin U n=1 Tax=Desulfoferula mesophila TaxID=3058419 RepID=A0AAU9EB96_9BACT|nr:hypothetical protein FAK_08730 [Desulfoferula mesophilus]